MATVVFEVLKKPIEHRLIDAACIYWAVDRDYFNQFSKKNIIVYRRSIIYYLIRLQTEYSYEAIAGLFGLTSHQPVIRSIENIRARKSIYQQVCNDIAQITNIADILDAKFISCAISLHNKNPQMMYNSVDALLSSLSKSG